jgi:hypothetical protein
MTMPPEHPDFEDLSAFHDGEAPEWADHLAGCASCRDDLRRLTALSEAVGRVPLAAGDPGDTYDPVARAVAASRASDTSPTPGIPLRGPLGPSAEPGRSGPGRRRQWVLGASVAAVLAVTIAIGATVAGKEPQREVPRDTLSADGARRTAGAAAGRGGSVIEGGDLGEISDRAALVSRVGADLVRGNRDRPAQPPSPSPATGAPVGPPCEVEARADPGARGELVYRATGVEAGTPAVVLAFASADASGRVTVEARALSGCRVLLQGSIP